MSRTPNSRELSLAGWRSRLGAFVVGALVVQAATGLWTYLAPFSLAAQVQMLLHTVLGVVLLGPLVWQQVRHIGAWARQKPTDTMVLGYVLLVAVAVCVVSGVVVTWQAAFGDRVTVGWDLTHFVSGIATTALLVAHLFVAVVRRSAAAIPELRAARWAFARRSGSVVGVCLAIVFAAVWLVPERVYTRPVPADYTIPAYAGAETEFAGSPFAPSNARTSTGGFVESDLLAGSESCGTTGCHEEILAEWRPSAHRFAAMNPPFQQVQRQFADDRSPADTRYCAGCHDPVSLFDGAKDMISQDLSSPGVDEGISCVACHSMSSADTRGNADYELTPPRKYIGEGTTGLLKAVSDFLVRAYPRQHLLDYDRNLLRTPESCAACHKQTIPAELNRFGVVPGQNQYDEWANGHWHSEDPEVDLSCTDCHMRLVPDSRDPGRGEGGDSRRASDDGKHRHHGFIATNNFMPEVLKLRGWKAHQRMTEEWVRGETVLPEIDHLWPRGPVATLEVLGTPADVKAGEELTLRLVVVNRKAGHNFITGPLDFVRSWVHIVVKDASGRVLDERGMIDPETRRILDRAGVPHTHESDPRHGTIVLEANPVDAEGNVLERHELWRKAGGRDKRVVFPRHSDAQVYRFPIPRDARGPLTVTAELLYRRYRQRFLELVVPEMESDSGVLQRTIRQHAVEVTIPVRTERAR